jgi:MFS family permease
LTATVYLPLISLLSVKFHTSTEAINLTITVYLIVQAISPAIFATLSDSLGRRPIYLITFTLYTIASLGLALNEDSYGILLILRAVQSLGASAVLSVAYGVVADVCVPAERGGMLGPMMALTNLGPCIGPVIGGWIALWTGGFKGVFWFLLIYAAAVLVTLGCFFPETSRNVVGNGSFRVDSWRRTWWSFLNEWVKRRRWTIIEGTEDGEAGSLGNDSSESTHGKKHQISISNPLSCLQIMAWKDTAPVLWMGASFYAVYYCIQTSIPSTYKNIYDFNELQIGFSYVTGGAGVILGGYANGKLMDKNYKAIAKEIGHSINRVSGDDLTHFPIERARARSAWYMLGTFVCALTGYGWALEAHAHVSIPLMLQFVHGFLCTCFLQTFSALLVDIFPTSPGTAAASGNIFRCALSALGVALVQPLAESLGRGWYFTFLSILSGLGSAAAIWIIQTNGMKWRTQRWSNTTEIHEREDLSETRPLLNKTP